MNESAAADRRIHETRDEREHAEQSEGRHYSDNRIPRVAAATMDTLPDEASRGDSGGIIGIGAFVRATFRIAHEKGGSWIELRRLASRQRLKISHRSCSVASVWLISWRTNCPAEFSRRPSARRRQATKARLAAIQAKLHGEQRSALCLSGGGIRSATFALGVVQALAKRDLLTAFDYLSTVSGGGYLGGWLSAWIKNAGDARNGLPGFEQGPPHLG